MGTILRFSRSPDPLGCGIALATGGWASHVEFVVKGINGFALLGAIPKTGVSFRTHPGPQEREEYYEMPISSGHIRALTQLGKPYDWDAVLAWPLRTDWESPESWFCSELIAWSLGLKGFEKYSRVVPKDLLSYPCLRLVPPAFFPR